MKNLLKLKKELEGRAQAHRMNADGHRKNRDLMWTKPGHDATSEGVEFHRKYREESSRSNTASLAALAIGTYLAQVEEH